MLVLIFSTNFVCKVSHSKRNERDMMKNVYWSLCKLVVILVKLEFSRQSFEKYSNFMEILSVGAEMFHADGRTDATKPRVALRKYANASKAYQPTKQFPSCHLFICTVALRVTSPLNWPTTTTTFSEMGSAGSPSVSTRLVTVNTSPPPLPTKFLCLFSNSDPIPFLGRCLSRYTNSSCPSR